LGRAASIVGVRLGRQLFGEPAKRDLSAVAHSVEDPARDGIGQRQVA
jgi:hypothetical protein